MSSIKGLSMKREPFSFEKKLLVFSWLLYLFSLVLPAVVIGSRTLLGYEVTMIAMSSLVSADFSLLWAVMCITVVGNVISLFSILLIFLFDASNKSWLFYLLILLLLIMVAAITNMGLLVASRYSLHFAAYLWFVSYVLLLLSVFIVFKELNDEISH